MISTGITGLQRFIDGEPGVLAQGDAVALDPSQDGAVVRADPTDQTRMPVIGFAFRVRGSSVYVRSVQDVSLPGLERGSDYWADPETPGGITATPPEVVEGPLVLQVVGKAASATSLQISLGVPSVVVVDA